MAVRASLELAEHLDATYITESLWRHVTKRSSRGRLVSAWNHIEYALNSSGDISDFARYESLECSQSLTQKILDKPHAPFNTKLEALVLASYLPAYQKRAFGQEVDSEDCVGIYRSLGNAFGYMRPLQHGVIPSSTVCETLVLGLSARTQVPSYLLYPASPREEASETQAVNHDSYFVLSGTKLPVQQKLIETSAEYSPRITMLTLKPLIGRANRKAGFNRDDNIEDQLNHPVALMVAEANGEPLDRHEKQLLDCLSQAVVAHFREASRSTQHNLAA